MVEEKRRDPPISVNWSALSAVVAVFIAVAGSFVKTEIDMSAVQADLKAYENSDRDNRDAIAKLRESLVAHTGVIEALRAMNPRIEQQIDLEHAERIERDEAVNKRIDVLSERMATMLTLVQGAVNQVIDGDANKPKK
jgi:hypothetical protein